MKSILILCFVWIYVFPALPQTIGQDSIIILDELIISANKIPEMKSKVAQQVYIIEANTIANLNMQTTAELIGNSGVVAIQKSQQGGGSPQLRGFEASRILLVIDGVRMNNLIYRAGHLQNIITLDNNSIERAEILLGPSSTVYGSDALGGVIHFKTKEPKLTRSVNESLNFSGNAFYRYGTVNREQTQHLDINLGGTRFGSFTSFTFSDFNDLKMGKRKNVSLGEEFGLRNYYVQRSADNTQDILVENDNPYIQKFSGYKQHDLIQKFLFKPSERIKHTFNFQLSNSSEVPRYDRLTDADSVTGLKNAEWYYGPQKRLMAAYQLSVIDFGIFADGIQTTASYQRIQESRHDRKFNAADRRNQIEVVDVAGLTIDLQKTIGPHNIRYGFDGQFNSLRSTAHNLNLISGERTPVETRYPDGKNTMNFLTLYLTHTFDIGKKLTLNDGLRSGVSRLYAEFDDKTFFDFPFDEVRQNNKYFCGNIGLTFRPAKDWKLAFITSTGYRVPNIDDLSKVFETAGGNALIIPNAGVKPEKTLNFDLSLSRLFGNRFRWEGTVYYTSFFDAITTDSFSFNGQSIIDYNGQPTRVLANQNKRRAFITGFSSVFIGEVFSTFSVEGSFNYTRGRITSGSAESPLDHIPPPFGRVSFQYQKQKLAANAFVNFSGWKRMEDYFLNAEDNEAYAPAEGMPSWYTINFRLGYDFNNYLTLLTGVDNVLDLQYRTFSSGINAAGRNFSATLNVKF